MNKRLGGEAMTGLGAGAVSRESQENLRVAEDLCRRGKPNNAVPYLEKALDDPRNLDAVIQLAFLAPNLKASIELLLDAEKTGRRYVKMDLDPGCFDEDSQYVGRFWSLLETRPYMRVLQALVRFYQEDKRFDKAAEVGIEMLRLCPGDNLGQRYTQGSCLLKAKRYSDALSFAQAWLDPDVQIPERGGCAFRTPRKKPLTPAEIGRLNTYENASLVYTAALASYRLWGDCELARQYLLFAASLNSFVLLKVLARVDQPKALNNLPRSRNGPEDAHDYLWASQDLWMEDEIWNWVDSQEGVKALVLKNCSREGCGNNETRVGEFKRCSSCHLAYYCGSDCQKTDWKTHKTSCKERARQKAHIRAMQNGRVSKMDASIISATADFSTNIGPVATFFG